MIYFADIALLIVAIGLIATATEVITEVIKKVFEGAFTFSSTSLFVISAVLGVVFSVVMQVSIFDKAQVPLVIFILGQVLAGLIASRGANRAHEILDTIKRLKQK